MLILRVDAGGGLVQNDDGGVFQNGAGDGDALLLTAGEGAAALTHHGVIAVGQRHDEIVAAGLFGGLDHLRLGGVGLAEEDVGPDSVVEQVHVLEHHGDVAEQAVTGELLQAVAAHGDVAGLGIVEPGQQTANGRLAAAGGADDGGGGLFRDGEGDVLQHLTGIVAEADAVKGDVEVLRLYVPAVGVDEALAPQGVQLIHGVVNDAQGVGTVAEGLQTGEDAEGEEHEHQHQGEAHLTPQALERRRQRQTHAAAFQRQQVQGVAGDVAPLDLQMDLLTVGDGAGDGIHGRAAPAEGFYHRKAPGVLDDRAGHVPVGLGLHGGVDAAVMGDQQHAQQGQQRGGQRDQRRNGAAHGKAYEDHQEVQIAAHKVVDHADAHVLQRGQARGDGA